MLDSLDHVLVAVRDLDAATGVYRRLLGREPSWRGSHPLLGTANTLFRLERSYLELLAPSAESGWLHAHLEKQGEGLLGLAFGTADADLCAKTLRERGLSAADPVDGEGRDERSSAVRRWRNVHLPLDDTRGVLLFAIEHLSPPEALPAALPTAEAGVVQAIDHVVIRTADPESTLALYGDQLGLRLALDRTFEERGVRLIFFRVGGVTVEIATSASSATSAGAAPDPDARDEPWGLAWQVDDVSAAHARLRGDGFDMTDMRVGNKAGTRVCTVRSGTHGVPTLIIGPDSTA